MKISSSERILLLDLIQDLMGEESTDYYNEDAEGNEIETPYNCGFVMSDYTDNKLTLQAIYNKLCANIISGTHTHQ